jgi:hypothetical protein
MWIGTYDKRCCSDKFNVIYGFERKLEEAFPTNVK